MALLPVINQSFLGMAVAPTAKNSEMTSRGMPLVSGTFKKTKIQDMMHQKAKNVKTPERPMELSITGIK